MNKKAPTMKRPSLKTTTSGSSTGSKPAPKRPSPKRPSPKRPVPIVEEVTVHEPKKAVETPVKSKARPRQEAPKPIATAQHDHQESRPQPSSKSAPGGTAQLTYIALKELGYKDRLALSKALNGSSAVDFVPIIKRSELPKQIVMRKDEAQLRKLIESKPPERDTNIHYCPYCVDHMKFTHHSYSGYDKCVGCGISTRDYYVRADNGLFSK